MEVKCGFPGLKTEQGKYIDFDVPKGYLDLSTAFKTMPYEDCEWIGYIIHNNILVGDCYLFWNSRHVDLKIGGAHNKININKDIAQEIIKLLKGSKK